MINDDIYLPSSCRKAFLELKFFWMTNTSLKPVRVRLAPSPTGPLHIGTVRTAIFNWLFARQNGGKFILRIEDTDSERSKKEYEKEILEGLEWLGLNWDEGPEVKGDGYLGEYAPYRQSERGGIYGKYLEKLLDEKRAYFCYCTKEEIEAERQVMSSQGLPPKYGGHCRDLKEPPPGKKPQVIRFKTPEAKVEFRDLVRGKVVFDASLFGDLVIAKDLNTPLYNFAAVVDDSEMKISHVIRGEDHLSNTPKQILLQKTLGFEEPQYAHLPLILNPDRSKMSKRFAETSFLDYKKAGYLPAALFNFLALLGWHPKDDRELLTVDELIKEFDLKRAQKAGAVFNGEKLDWLQKEHLKGLSTDEIADYVEPILKEKNIGTTREFLKKVVDIERTRLKTLDELTDIGSFFFKTPDYDVKLLVWQEESINGIKEVLGEVLDIISGIKSENPDKDSLKNALSEVIEKRGRGVVLWPLRVALSGQAASPDPFDIMDVIGPGETVKRIEKAIDKIEGGLSGKQ